MCGITGYFGEGDEKLITHMLKVINHRGPDDSGYFVDDGIGIGNTRLSIVDIARGDQPMYNEDETVVVVFNGEIYNFQELMYDLMKKGHKFNTRCDTEVLAHLYEEFGTASLGMLNGMFAFAIYDTVKKRLFIARDKFGIKPLYFYYNRDFVFGSEMKSILEYPGIPRDIDPGNLAFYLSHGFSKLRSTPLRSIKKLLPGESLVIDNKGLRLNKYYQIPTKTKKRSYMDFKKATKEILNDSVHRRKMGDVPVSVFLSGGLDSSTVVALLAEDKDKSINTFSVGFQENTDETGYARIVADRFSTNHKELFLDPDRITKKIPDIMYHLEEPVTDWAVLPFYFLCQEAAKKFKVGLLGEGSDEIFGGYSHYPIFSKKFSLCPNIIKISLYNRYRTLMDPLRVSNLRSKSRFTVKKRDPFFDAQYYDLKNTLPGFQLHRVDKLSMAHSLEARVPFLDHRLVETALPAPEKYKLSGLTGKKVLLDMMKSKLPEAIIKRRKKPFSVPVKKIFDEQIRARYEDHIYENPKHDYLNVKKITKNINNKKLSPNQITALYFYSEWEKVYLRGEGA